MRVSEIEGFFGAMRAAFKSLVRGESRQYLANVGAHLTLSLLHRVVPNLPAGLRAGGFFLGQK